jgi:uncharacterized iron-regulated membrane protein
MHDHSCCVALFTAAIVAITGVVYYFKTQLSLARNNSRKKD